MSSLPPNSINLDDKIRQQYDFLPYPDSDIDYLPKDKWQSLFIHSLAIPYYLRYQKVVNPSDKIILDAGCGSGVQALVLALANPGAKIVGVDISPKSIELATQRLAHHGFENAEFHTLSLEDLTSLNYKYDYINCDEVLYLLPNPEETLQTFKSVLKPQGIIRTNLHSRYQRQAFFRSQEAFKLLGLLDETSTEDAIEVVQDTLNSLKDAVQLKRLFQGFESQQKPDAKAIREWILVNYLIQGDKGYTITDLFDFLETAELDFLSMVNWRQWDINALFKDPENISVFWEWALEEAGEPEKLQLFELFEPIHRLLDFWAVQPDDTPFPVSPVNWDEAQWSSCQVYINPILSTDKVKQDLYQAITERINFTISQYIPLPTLVPVVIDSLFASCLLPLWDSPQSFPSLVERWLLLQPRDPITLNPKTEAQARQELQQLLSKLEAFTYILLELPA